MPKIDANRIVELINEYAEENALFWLAGLAKETLPILKNHLDELHPSARVIVQTYLDERLDTEEVIG